MQVATEKTTERIAQTASTMPMVLPPPDSVVALSVVTSSKESVELVHPDGP
jgi:hypothetical protein